MNKYKKLVSNTFIFAVGTFSSKLLVFLLMPFYTRVLTSEQYGTVDLIMQTGNLLLPIVTLGITNAVIRFTLDSNFKRTTIFTTGALTLLFGLLVLFLFTPLINNISTFSGYGYLLFTFVFMSTIKGLISHFTRARQFVKLYSLDGILSTITTIFFTVLFLAYFKMGINGYILAIVVSDFLSIVFLGTVISIKKYFKVKDVKKTVVKEMLGYSIPLIPTNIFWWIINVSDRFIIFSLIDASANGLYAVAYKIPTFITLISSIFLDAWQLSAVTEKEGRSRFFSNIFNMYKSIIFIAISGLIMFCKLFTKLLVSDNFFESYQYVPILLIATGFSCMVSFLGSIYMLYKKSVLSLITIIVGAILNIVLNIYLIPIFGVHGAAFSTFLSFFVVFIIRLINTKRFIRLNINLLTFTLSLFLLLIQSYIIIAKINFWFIFQVLFFIAIVLVNLNDLTKDAKKLIKKNKK